MKLTDDEEILDLQFILKVAAHWKSIRIAGPHVHLAAVITITLV